MEENQEVTTSRSAAEKEASKHRNRAVSGKEAARGQRPGSGPRSASTQSGARRARPVSGGRGGRGARSRTTLFAWGAVGLVIVVVAVLVVVKATSSSTSTPTSTSFSALPDGIAHAISSVPASAYDKVGVTSLAPVTAPTVSSQPAPQLLVSGKPGVFYLGGEFCPYCAAERWALVTSLSRFGTFSGLGEMQSSSTDIAPNTQTFTFRRATYTSPYVALRPVEQYSNIADPATGYYTQLQPLTAGDRQLVKTYYSPKYLPGATAGQAGIPFIDIDNKVFVWQGSQFSPTILQNLSRQQIASGLTDPSNPVTQAILTASNYLSASICANDGQQPTAVCTSKGVTAAATALKLNR